MSHARETFPRQPHPISEATAAHTLTHTQTLTYAILQTCVQRVHNRHGVVHVHARIIEPANWRPVIKLVPPAQRSFSDFTRNCIWLNSWRNSSEPPPNFQQWSIWMLSHHVYVDAKLKYAIAEWCIKQKPTHYPLMKRADSVTYAKSMYMKPNTHRNELAPRRHFNRTSFIIHIFTKRVMLCMMHDYVLKIMR